jgi:hypothetical protein
LLPSDPAAAQVQADIFIGQQCDTAIHIRMNHGAHLRYEHLLRNAIDGAPEHPVSIF